jgi:hypothetical protein
VELPRVSIADVQRLAAGQLSLRSRVGYAALLVTSLTMVVGVGSLWATEPALPARTHVAFAMIVAMAAGWSVFAAWVLSRRRILLGTDRVIAATIGVAFSAVASVGTFALGYWGGGGSAAYAAALIDAGLCLVAVVFWLRARRRLEMLMRRRRALEFRPLSPRAAATPRD